MNSSTLAISPPIDRILRGGGKAQVNSDGSVTITPAGGLGFDLDGSMAWDTTLGSEKVTNGSFTGAATGWTLAAGWTYNTNAVDKDSNGTGTLSQDVSAVANEVYKVVYTVSGWSVGTVTVAVGGVSGTARGANDTYTEFIAATGTGSLTFTPTNTARLTVDTVSVKRVAVIAADRVTMWAGDRLSSGVEQAGDAGLFIRSEDGTLSFIGDTTQLGGALLINATSAYGRNSQKLEANQSADEGGAALNTWSATAAEAAMFDFNRSKSATIGTHTVVASADALGFLTFRGSDGTAFIEGAQIRGEVDGTPGTNDMPGRLVFLTTADGAASLTERMRLDSAGKLLINATASYGRLGQLLEVHQAANYGGFALFNWQNANQQPLLELYKSRGDAVGAHAIVENGDVVGHFGGRASDGSAFRDVAYAQIVIDGAPGASDMPGAWVFYTTPDGSASSAERLKIDSAGMARFLNGNVKIANSTDGGTGGMHIRSKRAVSAAMSSGTTANIATQIPSGAMILGASFNVDTAITGATSWAAAFNTGSTTALVTGQAVTLNTKANKLVVPEIATAATDITITGSGGDFTAGVIEALVYYVDQTSMANA